MNGKLNLRLWTSTIIQSDKNGLRLSLSFTKVDLDNGSV